MLTDAEIDVALRNIDRLDPRHKERMLQLLEERDRLSKLEQARERFEPFVKTVWPDVIWGAHHTILAEKFEKVASGEITRLIINIAPRHGKSEFTSWLLPSWYLGRVPGAKIMQCMNTQDLAANFGRRVRNTISREALATAEKGDDPYHDVFPDIDIALDSGAAGHWHTTVGGEYYAVGVGGKIAGRGADLLIIDDPTTEQEARQAVTNTDIFDTTYDWYVYGPRQRLQPGGRIVVIQTRWHKRDLTGRLIKKMTERGLSDHYDDWHVIEFPAILDEDTPNERPLWPQFWKLDSLRATRAELPVTAWKAQYQQQPTSEEGALIKRESWRKWGDTDETCPGPNHAEAWANMEPPACEYIIMSWDTALKKTERADYSAMTVWGIFLAEDKTTGNTINNIILLSAYKARLEFPELKKRIRQFHADEQPDTILIEDKGSGTSLIQELRAMGVPVEAFGYGRGSRAFPNDKIARTNLITDIFASGYVWAPDRRYAEEVAAECAEFPAGLHDDYVDSTVQAMLRFRAGGFIRTANDDDEDAEASRYIRKRFY